MYAARLHHNTRDAAIPCVYGMCSRMLFIDDSGYSTAVSDRISEMEKLLPHLFIHEHFHAKAEHSPYRLVCVLYYSKSCFLGLADENFIERIDTSCFRLSFLCYF